MIRSRAHICALLLAAGLGVPISAVAYLFLALVGQIGQVIFSALPQELLGGQVLSLPTTSAPESISG